MAEPIGYMMQRVEIYELTPEQKALKHRINELITIMRAGREAEQLLGEVIKTCKHEVSTAAIDPNYPGELEKCAICGTVTKHNWT